MHNNFTIKIDSFTILFMKLKKDLIARKILKTNIYMTLATADAKGEPWASPVFYCKDNKNNLYFISPPSSKHMKNIEGNNRVSFAIFDSRQPQGDLNGIQGYGEVNKLTGNNLVKGLKYYNTTFIKITAENLQNDAPYRLYKLAPRKMYVVNTDLDVDCRIEVLKKSKVEK